MFDLPIIMIFFPVISVTLLINLRQPRGVQGITLGLPWANKPIFKEWNPSTSFSNDILSITLSLFI